MISSRRRFLFGAGAALLAAPAIVRVSSLMAVKPLPLNPPYGLSPAAVAMSDMRLLWEATWKAAMKQVNPPVIDLGNGTFSAVRSFTLPPIKWFSLEASPSIAR